MIVTRTPLRLSLGGGGTDLPFYADKFGGSMITASINKYIYIMVGDRLQGDIKLNYSQTEIIDSVQAIKHPLMREALKLTGISKSIEIHSMADLPSGTGLGSSFAFLVGLLNALYYYKGEIISRYKMAEDASHITMDILKEPCGKQDQYASAFGSINHLKISPNGKVTVTPINITQETITRLEKNLMLFYTGFTRATNEILSEQKKEAEKDKGCEDKKGKKGKGKKEDKGIYSYYHEIKKIGEESKKCLENGDLKRFGEWMNIHWELKKSIAKSMSNSKIDEWYALAMANGALGGKIIGAGGGGFMVFYVDKNHDNFKGIMEKQGLVYVPFKFDFDGSRIIYQENVMR